MLFRDLINCEKNPHETTVQPKSILVIFNVCVVLFFTNWTSGQAVVRGWAGWPLVPEVKNHTDCKPKWRSSAWWWWKEGGTFHLRHNCWHLKTCDPSLPSSVLRCLSHFQTHFFGMLRGITNLVGAGLRLKTSLCATSLYFSEEKWECVCNPCVYCQLALDALWPNDWSDCVLCTKTNCLLELRSDWSQCW